MNQSRHLPAGLRQLLEQALELVGELRDPRLADEDVLLQQLDDLKSRVADALSEVRASDLSFRQDLMRPLKVADGILLYLTDPTQRDARGRLRDVARLLQEALE
jgi:hypothetical protein